ncbi:MAG: hypothetical protein NVSMB64_22350 [Candidatus Velthaea sp.]
MLNLELLTELGRERRRDVARDIARNRHAPSTRAIFGRTLVALGALAVMLGTALDEDPERKPEIVY